MPFDSAHNEKSKLSLDLIGFEDAERRREKRETGLELPRLPAPERLVPSGAAQAPGPAAAEPAGLAPVPTHTGWGTPGSEDSKRRHGVYTRKRHRN